MSKRLQKKRVDIFFVKLSNLRKHAVSLARGLMAHIYVLVDLVLEEATYTSCSPHSGPQDRCSCDGATSLFGGMHNLSAMHCESTFVFVGCTTCRNREIGSFFDNLSVNV